MTARSARTAQIPSVHRPGARPARSIVIVAGTLCLCALARLAAAAGLPSYTFFHAGIPASINGTQARLVLVNGALPNWPGPLRWAMLSWDDSSGGGFLWTDRGIYFNALPHGYVPRAMSGAGVAVETPDEYTCGWWDFYPNTYPPMPVNATFYPSGCTMAGIASSTNGVTLTGTGTDANGNDDAFQMQCDPNPRTNNCYRSFLGGPGTSSSAHGMNGAGTMVGTATMSNGVIRAIWYDPSYGVVDFDPGHAAYSSYGRGINDSAQAVGWILPGACPPGFSCYDGHARSKGYNSHYMPVVFNTLPGSGTPTYLGSISGGRDGYVDGTAQAINSAGWIVGYSTTGSGAQHAFLYVNNIMHDLNTLNATGATGWTMTDATAINDEGQIVGHATNAQGQTEVYLLTP